MDYMILRRRTQLLNWLEQNAPTASIRRAVGEGSVEFLGWFKEVPGSNYPGWITKVTSTITDIVWYVVVRVCWPTHYAWVLDEDRPVPWQHWNPIDSENPFFYGDNAEKYRQNRESAQTQRRQEVHQEDNTP